MYIGDSDDSVRGTVLVDKVIAVPKELIKNARLSRCRVFQIKISAQSTLARLIAQSHFFFKKFKNIDPC